MSADAAIPGVFVTGTGTEVGKTMVAASIARAAVADGHTVGVFKPAVSGLDELGEAEADHLLLRRAAGSAQTPDEIAPYRYGPPVSPHLGARLAGREIDPRVLRRAAARARHEVDLLVVEGVGGFLVPLTGDYLVRDLARDLALPVVIAASPGLGTINHTLLTLEAVRSAGLDVLAVVLTPWPGDPSPVESSNRATIAALGEVEVATLCRYDPAEPPESWSRPGFSLRAAA